MITSTYLWLLVTFACFFLYLGFTRKQFLMVLISGVLFIACVGAVGDGLVISDHLVNHTEENKTPQLTVVTYTYDHELMTPFVSNIFISIFLILGLICIVFGTTMFWLNPNLANGKDNSGFTNKEEED